MLGDGAGSGFIPVDEEEEDDEEDEDDSLCPAATLAAGG